MPNRASRIGARATAVRAGASALRDQFDGRPLLLTTPGSVNWITGGLSDPVDITATSDPVWVVDGPQGRAMIINEIEVPRLLEDFDIANSDWELIGVPWYDPDAPLEAVAQFTGLRTEALISDREGMGTNVMSEIVRTRMVLTEPERDDLRDLGALCARALEAGIDSWRPGRSTDFDVAAAISYVLEQDGAKAVCLIVGGDSRMRSMRHPLAIGAVVHDALMAVVVARRGGLHVAATRIAVRDAGDPIVELCDELARVNDGVLEASLPGGTWGAAVNTLAAGYESIGREGTWREHYQGGPIAYEQREFELAPGMESSPFWNLETALGVAIAWNPSALGGAKIEDTYLVGADGLELVTASDAWPTAAGGLGARSQVKIVQ